jgi:hypothetical protein
MEHRTRNQENKYVMALGYAWRRKDAAPYGSDSGRKAMVTGAMDFATWYAAAFTELSPEAQRELANTVKTLPYVER